MQTSYSKNNTYITCPKHWDLSYNEKWESPEKGASLYFGSAIDAAVTDMLLAKPDWLQTFYDKWTKAWSFGVATQIFDNPGVVYAYKDFDEHVLEQKDTATLETWAKGLKLIDQTMIPTKKDLVSVYNTIAAKKKNPYVKVTQDEMTFFNRASWLSMKRKGKILLNAFNTQFLPKVKTVHATQQRASLTDPNTGDSIVGFVDMVLEIEGYDKPIIFDLKTAGQPYSQDNIDLTDQLTLYAGMKGQDYNTDLVGYVVLCKNIQKTTVGTCKSCGNIKNSQHKTCDAVVNGTRCKGEWDEIVKPNPVVQVLVEKKSPEQIQDLFNDIGNIITAMKNKIVYKNTSKCKDWYGGTCPFYNACHKNDFTGLTKRNSGGSNGP